MLVLHYTLFEIISSNNQIFTEWEQLFRFDHRKNPCTNHEPQDFPQKSFHPSLSGDELILTEETS